jgi:hypothetical protein
MNVGNAAVLVGGCLLLGFIALLALLYLQRSQTKEKKLTKGQKLVLKLISQGLNDHTMRRFFRYERNGGPLWQTLNSINRSDVRDEYYQYLVKLHASLIGETTRKRQMIIEGLTTWKLKSRVELVDGEGGFVETRPLGLKQGGGYIASKAPSSSVISFSSPPLINMSR